MISRRTGTAASYYIYDGGLSVRALTNESGTVTDTLVFDAFGNETAKTGSTDNPYGFQGEEKDETGLYYLRARYMDPSTGTFTSMDTYGGSLSDPMSLHKYMFANSNPVMYSDPSGHFSAKEELGVIAIQGVLGAAVSGVMYRLDWLINDPGSERHSWGEFAWQVCYGFVFGALSAKLGFGLLGLNLSIYDYFIIAIVAQIASLEIKDMAEVLGKQTGNPLVWGVLNGIGDGTQIVSNAAVSAMIVKGLQGFQNSKQSASGNNKRVVSSETNSAGDNTSDGCNRVKVGRWMSKEEYGEMVRTGKVQQSTNNRNGTHVSYPADPNSFKGHSTNAVYVEFEVDPSRLANAGRSDWKIVTAPGSYIDRLNQAHGGAPYTGMPNAYNIVILGGG